MNSAYADDSGESLDRCDGRRDGTVLLNAFGIGSDMIDFVADDLTMRDGSCLASAFRSDRPTPRGAPADVCVLSRGTRDESSSSQSAYRSLAAILIPVPTVRCVIFLAAS